MKNKILLLSILAASALCLTSCHDDIYYMISQEEKLETNGISGTINSIVQFGDSLYTQNGSIYKKTNDSSSITNLYNKQWTKIADPSDSSSTFYEKYVYKLAADSTYLYAFAVSWYDTGAGEKDPDSKYIYYSSDGGATWAAIADTSFSTILGGTDSKTNIVSIFCNGATAEGNRKAYARLYSTTDGANHIYLLNGGTIVTPYISTNGADSSTVAATYFSKTDDTYFSDSHAINSNGTYLYYSNGTSVVYYANGWNSSGYTLDGSSTVGSVSIDAGTIYDIGVTKDYLLLGTSAGIKHTLLDSSSKIPAASTSEFENNATSALTSSYKVNTLFVLDPTQNEYNTDLYATTEYEGTYTTSTTALFDEIGLWAYYPGRGTWNKDGTADDTTNGN